MNWQAMMKHEAGCLRARNDCEGCAHLGEEGCIRATENQICPCTCRRDEIVAAIEAMMEAARTLRSTYCYPDSEEKSELEDKLWDALDRLNTINNPNEPKGT